MREEAEEAEASLFQCELEEEKESTRMPITVLQSKKVANSESILGSLTLLGTNCPSTFPLPEA